MPTLNRRQFLGRASASAAATLLLPRAWAAEGPAALPTHRPLGVALVGLGRYSTYQLGPALRQTRRCRLAAVVTGDPGKGAKWSREYGFPAASVYSYDTMARLADNPDVDVVYVVTPNALHRPHVVAAARAGKQVMCEKPMATSVADCDAMIAACREAGVRLAIGYRLHYEPHTMELIRIAQTGEFGRFIHMEGSNSFVMGDGANPQSVWRLNRKLAGGGPLMDMGVYLVQAVCMAQREAAPVAVRGVFGPVTRPDVFPEVEESLHWTMEFADGARAECDTSYNATASRFRATAERGWVDLGRSAFPYNGQVVRTSAGTRHFPHVNHQASEMDGIVAEWQAGQDARVPGQMGRRDVGILQAIYRSAEAGGRRVTL